MRISAEVEGLARLAGKSREAARIVQNEVRKALTASGLLVETAVKKSIQQGAKAGAVYEKYNPRRTHRASAPGQAPASDTGRLVNSIHVRMSQAELAAEVVAGGSAVPYATLLEFGTRTIAPRPFMQPALEKNRVNIRKRFEKALLTSTARIDRR